jgi:hypothetical protein
MYIETRKKITSFLFMFFHDVGIMPKFNESSGCYRTIESLSTAIEERINIKHKPETSRNRGGCQGFTLFLGTNKITMGV